MRVLAGIVGVVLVLTACGGAPATSVPLTSASSPPAASTSAQSPAPSALTAEEAWAEDLAQLDHAVRQFHPSPFTIHPESEWTAKLAELQTTLPTADPDQQFVQLASLVGLLDTHSSFTSSGLLHQYEVLLYRFADGWFVVRAKDPSLVGTRLVSIDGTSAADIEAALRPLVPADNESGRLDALEGPMSSVEFLHGAGIADDPNQATFVLARPDGTQVTAVVASTDQAAWEQELGIIGDLMGDAPEAVARRDEPVWTHLDKATKTFVLSFNDYEGGQLPAAIEAMTKALDDGSAKRVVLDMRYIRGGNGSLADPLIEALTSDARINRPGGLTVMTGRENVSAGTLVAATLDARTKATFVGEQTPARAANFLCDCHDIALAHSGFIVTVPTQWNNTGDTRDSVPPDVAYALKSTDFFAGKDPLLDAVMRRRPAVAGAVTLGDRAGDSRPGAISDSIRKTPGGP